MTLKDKLTSRKFWAMLAAFCTSFAAGLTAYLNGNVEITLAGLVCSVLAPAVYTVCESYVDGKRAPQETTVTTTTLTGRASSAQKEGDK